MFTYGCLLQYPVVLVSATQYIEEITEGADKQLKIELGLAEITEKWAAEAFIFSEWKGRGINVLKSTGTIVEELEEAQVCLPSCLLVCLSACCRSVPLLACSVALADFSYFLCSQSFLVELSGQVRLKQACCLHVLSNAIPRFDKRMAR